ncbi:MAG: GNAT family N-acetyltransferase [Candidatus Eisenbacteria sp.]|nr:GNAT family N-acetyltransferase [Candidatus Eisenbacteria bacterium]
MENRITVRQLTKGELDEIALFLERCPHLPYTCYPEVTPSSSARLVLSEIRGLLEAGGFCLAGMRGGGPVGLVTGQELGWDSEQLGVAAGRLTHLLVWDPEVSRRSLVREAVDECRRRGILHLSCRVPSPDIPSVHALQAERFRVVEALLTFGFRHGRDQVRMERSGALVAPCDGSEEEIRWVAGLAAVAFDQDRFHVDPRVPRERADELHRAWIENSCRGFADVVFVARDAAGGARLGFLSCKKQEAASNSLPLSFANIVLGAVAPEARGRGVYTDLNLEAMDWSQARVDVLEVGTQYTNVQAARLYMRTGFQYVRADVSLRLWME